MTDVESAFRMDTGFRAPDEDMDSEYGEPTFGLRPLPGAAALQTAANVADVAQYTTRALPFAAGLLPPPQTGAIYLKPGAIPDRAMPKNGSGFVVLDRNDTLAREFDPAGVVNPVDVAGNRIYHVGGGARRPNAVVVRGVHNVVVSTAALDAFMAGLAFPVSVGAVTMDDDAEIGRGNAGPYGHWTSRAALVVNVGAAPIDAGIRLLGTQTVLDGPRDLTVAVIEVA